MHALIMLALRLGVPARFAKAATIAAIVILAVLLIGIGKCAYDRRVIARHEADEAAKMAPKIRKADEAAATAREQDNAQIARDEKDTTDALKTLPDQGLTDRQRARACVVLKRQAAAANRPAPGGC